MKYFTIHELSKSETATKLGIYNVPNANAIQALIDLVDNILDPLRTAWGKPIVVNSGYRSYALNNKVGGSSTSQHLCLNGAAADIEASSRSYKDNMALLKLIKRLNLPYDLVIYEFGTSEGPEWIHISFGPRNRRNALRSVKKNGRTLYLTYQIPD